MGDYCDILFTVGMLKNFHTVADFQFFTSIGNRLMSVSPVLFTQLLPPCEAQCTSPLLTLWTQPKDILWPTECEWTYMGQAGPLTVLAWFAVAPHIPTFCSEKSVLLVAVSSVVIPGKNAE